jgi:hypothetical protein
MGNFLQPSTVEAKSLMVDRLDIYPIYTWRLLDGEMELRDAFALAPMAVAAFVVTRDRWRRP